LTRLKTPFTLLEFLQTILFLLTQVSLPYRKEWKLPSLLQFECCLFLTFLDVDLFRGLLAKTPIYYRFLKLAYTEIIKLIPSSITPLCNSFSWRKHEN